VTLLSSLQSTESVSIRRLADSVNFCMGRNEVPFAVGTPIAIDCIEYNHEHTHTHIYIYICVALFYSELEVSTMSVPSQTVPANRITRADFRALVQKVGDRFQLGRVVCIGL
jgi:hypothetical protein